MIKHLIKASAFFAAVAVIGATVAISAEKDPLASRVPPDQLADAKKAKSPVPANPATIRVTPSTVKRFTSSEPEKAARLSRCP